MDELKVALVQQDIVWEDAGENLKRLDEMFLTVDEDVDMVILPEMFHSGFTMNPKKVAQSQSGEVLSWMKTKALELKICLLGGVVFKAEDGFYNRMQVYFPDGECRFYDKRHLFGFGGENENYKQGNNRLIFEYKGWKICPLICYDLRFPVWSRNDEDYDVLIYVANWPKSRSKVWSALLPARAIENQSYVIGVNRVGCDFANQYSGDSVVIDAKGNDVLELEPYKQCVDVVKLSKTDLSAFRNKFPVLKDRDRFEIKI